MRIRGTFLLSLFCLPIVSQAQLVRTPLVTGMTNSITMAQPRGELNRMFFVEQRGTSGTFGTSNGRISLSKRTGSTWGARQTFATIPGIQTSGGERGLLGLTFHPNFATNRKFYINQTNSTGATEIRQGTASLGNPDVADAGTTLVIRISQDFSNHNGGHLAFGPDGYLYIGMGDGGSGNDPNNRALDINSLLGKMLRLDVDRDDFPADANKNYGIPADNPYVGVTGADEIWAIGLRNPWKFAFDRNDLNGFDSLTIADVGQDAREEVNHVVKGASNVNYGWRVFEGLSATGLTGYAGLPTATPPIMTFSHPFSQSIAGGEIYRGWELGPEFWNHYFVSDTVTQWFGSFAMNQNPSTGAATAVIGAGPFSSLAGSLSFGVTPIAVQQDNAGEIWLIDYSGNASRITRTFGSGISARNLSGTINLNNLTTQPMGLTVNIDVTGVGGTSDFALPVGLKPNKTYRIPTTNVAGRAWIDYGTFLRRVLPFNAVGGNVSGLNFELINGDIDNDGEIGPGDFEAVVNNFGLGGPNVADVDGDGEVGPGDFETVVSGFGLGDDPL
jgi:glucose/arabinose dehydrogenase